MATVVGLFRSEDAAEQAINDLKAAGYNPDKIGVVAKDAKTSRAMAADNEVNDAGVAAGAGAVEGTIVGGALAALIATGTILALPIVGPLALAGSVLGWTALGAGIGAATGGAAGALLAGLTEQGVEEEEARYYETAVGEGGILLTVDDDGHESNETRRILLNAGAEDVQGRMGSTGDFAKMDSGTTTPAMLASDTLSGGATTTSNEIAMGNDYVTTEDTIAAGGSAGLARANDLVDDDYAKRTSGSQYASTVSNADSNSFRTDTDGGSGSTTDMEQASTAVGGNYTMGDYSDGVTESSGRDFATEVGDAVNRAGNDVSGMTQPVINETGSSRVLDYNTQGDINRVNNTVQGAGSIVGNAAANVGSTVGNTLANAGSAVGSAIGGAASAVGNTFDRTGDAVGDAARNAGPALDRTGDAVSEPLPDRDQVGGAVQETFGNVERGVGQVFGSEGLQRAGQENIVEGHAERREGDIRNAIGDNSPVSGRAVIGDRDFEATSSTNSGGYATGGTVGSTTYTTSGTDDSPGDIARDALPDGDQVAGGAQETWGNVKRGVGEVLGNDDLQNSGQRDVIEGSAQRAKGDIENEMGDRR